MINDSQDHNGAEQHKSRALLDELGSIKELLDKELDNPLPCASVNDIRSVEEYLRLKQLATDSGLSIDDYLSRRTAAHPDAVEPQSTVDDEEEITLLDECHASREEEAPEGDKLLLELVEETALDEAIPVLNEAVNPDENIPVLDDVTAASPDVTQEPLTLEELQELVDLIVGRKLERLKPELEREVMAELRKLLPLPNPL
jgi:hypothetical protein